MFDDLKKKQGHPAKAHGSLGNTPDGPAINPYPITYPKGADEQVDNSIHGCYENYKTVDQGSDLDPKKKGA